MLDCSCNKWLKCLKEEIGFALTSGPNPKSPQPHHLPQRPPNSYYLPQVYNGFLHGEKIDSPIRFRSPIEINRFMRTNSNFNIIMETTQKITQILQVC